MTRLTIASRTLLVATLFSAGTAVAGEPDAPAPLVSINDFTLTTLHLGLFASQTGRNPQQPEEQIRMLNELASNFMLANSTQGRALEQRPEIRAALEVARARLLAQTFVREQLGSAVIEEAEVRKRYDATYGGEAGREFKARHILLATREEALEVIAALNAGGDFTSLAKQRSTGPSAGAGGDLGWFEADQMVPEFAAATATLADGEYSREPVKTEFGWHVILLEESRAIPRPDFATVKPEIDAELRQEAVAKTIAGIRAATDIKVHVGEDEVSGSTGSQ